MLFRRVDKTDELKVDETDEFSKDHSRASLLVAFHNIQGTIIENVLSVLMELISGLSEANGDFSVEVISNIKVAVMTFLKNTGVRTSVNACVGHNRVQQFEIFPRLLELTRTIRVENLPPQINNS